jgi:hypothetical protein
MSLLRANKSLTGHEFPIKVDPLQGPPSSAFRILLPSRTINPFTGVMRSPEGTVPSRREREESVRGRRGKSPPPGLGNHCIKIRE